MLPITYYAAPGGTYYVFPSSQSLADWATYQVLLTEGTGVNAGKYSGMTDETYGYIGHIFEGSAQPTWIDAVAVVDLSGTVAALNADATQAQARADAATAANALSPGATSTETWTVVTDSPTQLVINKAVS